MNEHQDITQLRDKAELLPDILPPGISVSLRLLLSAAWRKGAYPRKKPSSWFVLSNPSRLMRVRDFLHSSIYSQGTTMSTLPSSLAYPIRLTWASGWLARYTCQTGSYWKLRIM